jgi:hypothetical protein
MRAFRRAGGNDFGASAVEFALIFPIFMTLALGTIAAGTAFSKQINVTQAAREASRYGGTYDIKASPARPLLGIPAGNVASWLIDLDDAAQASAGAPNNPIAGYDYRCVAYITTNAAGAVIPASSRHKENGGAMTNGACPGTRPALIPSTDYVQVAIARNSSFFLLFANPTIQLDGLSYTPYEPKAPDTL